MPKPAPAKALGAYRIELHGKDDYPAYWSVSSVPLHAPSGPARTRLLEKAEQLQASIRAKDEHPFHMIKNLFRHRKTRYKGPAKNEAQLFSLFGLANLVITKRSMLVAHTRGAS